MRIKMLVILFIAICYPFVCGENGCGGQVKGGAWDTEEAAPAPGDTADLRTGALTDFADPGVPEDQGSAVRKEGPTDIICQPGIPPAKERVAPGCADFLPQAVDATMIADMSRINFEMVDKMGWQKQLMNGLDPIGLVAHLSGREESGIDQFASICVACSIRQKDAAAAPALMGSPAGVAPNAMMEAKDKDRFNIDACEKFIVIYGFKDGMNPGVKSLAKDVNADADGIYPVKDLAAAESGNFLFIGSKDKEFVKAALGGAHEYQPLETAFFMPATAVFTAKGEAISAGFHTPIFDAFKVLPLPFDAFKDVVGVNFAGAVDLQNLMTVAAAIYDKDMQALARSVLAIGYKDFQIMLDAQNKEQFVIADKEQLAKQMADMGEQKVTIDRSRMMDTSKLVNLCHNGVDDPGEDCDGQAEKSPCWPDGSGVQKICVNCRCVPGTPVFCGDTEITPPEQCEPLSSAPNHGCPSGQYCDNNCMCRTPATPTIAK